MLHPERVAEVIQLLAEGRSQRAISRTTGVSRGSVGRIASGRRPAYADQPANRLAQPPIEDGPRVRCLGCGGLQTLPCRVCATREAQRAAGPHPPPRADVAAPSGPGLGLDLKPEHAVGYRRARRQREADERFRVTPDRRLHGDIDQQRDTWAEPVIEDCDSEEAA